MATTDDGKIRPQQRSIHRRHIWHQPDSGAIEIYVLRACVLHCHLLMLICSTVVSCHFDSELLFHLD